MRPGPSSRTKRCTPDPQTHIGRQLLVRLSVAIHHSSASCGNSATTVALRNVRRPLAATLCPESVLTYVKNLNRVAAKIELGAVGDRLVL